MNVALLRQNSNTNDKVDKEIWRPLGLLASKPCLLALVLSIDS